MHDHHRCRPRRRPAAWARARRTAGRRCRSLPPAVPPAWWRSRSHTRSAAGTTRPWRVSARTRTQGCCRAPAPRLARSPTRPTQPSLADQSSPRRLVGRARRRRASAMCRHCPSSPGRSRCRPRRPNRRQFDPRTSPRSGPPLRPSSGHLCQVRRSRPNRCYPQPLQARPANPRRAPALPTRA